MIKSIIKRSFLLILLFSFSLNIQASYWSLSARQKTLIKDAAFVTITAGAASYFFYKGMKYNYDNIEYLSDNPFTDFANYSKNFNYRLRLLKYIGGCGIFLISALVGVIKTRLDYRS